MRSRRGLEVRPSDAGIHLVGWLPERVDAEAASARALEAGIEAPPLSRYAVRRPSRGGLVLGWAAYSAGEIEDGVKRLAGALS
jgi:GntR family transcriptional regulator/MocR family aminotransferase